MMWNMKTGWTLQRAFVLGLLGWLLLGGSGAWGDGSMKMVSPAFAWGGHLPARYALCGPGARNLSPPLVWSDAPRETASFVLLVLDPDAPRGTFVHWVVYDLPASVRRLDEGVSGARWLREGRNGYGKMGYGGPCPPRGSEHRYVFRLYALATPTLGLPAGATAAQVEAAMAPWVLAEAEGTVLYGR